MRTQAGRVWSHDPSINRSDYGIVSVTFASSGRQGLPANEGASFALVNTTVAICTAIVLWSRAVLILAGTMTVDELTVYLAYLTKFFKPVKDLATTTNAVAQATVGVERVRTIRDADQIAVIQGGVVAESGTHDQLMARDGLYAELHRTQFDAGSDKVVSGTAPNLP